MPYDAEEVLKIRLPKFDMKDFVSWPQEKSGIFSVRSAYKLALDEKTAIHTNSSHSSNGDRRLWKSIWKANVPPKIRVFTWRLATNSLAVQVNRSIGAFQMFYPHAQYAEWTRRMATML
jgi:hypothetical protein